MEGQSVEIKVDAFAFTTYGPGKVYRPCTFVEHPILLLDEQQIAGTIEDYKVECVV